MSAVSELEVVVHAGEGTGPDVMAHAIVTAGVRLGVLPPDTVITHRPGHDGAETITYLADHPGSSTLMSTCTPTFLTTPMKYNLASSSATLTPICQLVADSYLLVTSSATGWTTVTDLVDDSQRNPGGVTVGAAPRGGNNHIHAYLLSQATGSDFDLRFFPDSRHLLLALSDGAIGWTTAVAAELQHEAWREKVRVIGVLSEKRSPLFPDVPTLQEQATPVTFALWRGMIGPPYMPSEVLKNLQSALRAVIQSDEWSAYLAQNGQQAAFLESDAFADVLRREERNYRAWLTALGVLDAPAHVGDRTQD